MIPMLECSTPPPSPPCPSVASCKTNFSLQPLKSNNSTKSSGTPSAGGDRSRARTAVAAHAGRGTPFPNPNSGEAAGHARAGRDARRTPVPNSRSAVRPPAEALEPPQRRQRRPLISPLLAARPAGGSAPAGGRSRRASRRRRPSPTSARVTAAAAEPAAPCARPDGCGRSPQPPARASQRRPPEHAAPCARVPAAAAGARRRPLGDLEAGWDSIPGREGRCAGR